MVEEVLQNPRFEDFVKSFREGSKATIVQRVENRSGQFLEAAVYAVSGSRGLILIPEGHDGRGWSRVSGELSKALSFLEAIDGSPSSRGPLAMKKLGKEVGFLLFAEVMHSAATISIMGCRPLVQTTGLRGAAEVEDARLLVDWCELEKFHPLGMDWRWFGRDCYALEMQSLGPLGKNLRVDDRFSFQDFGGSLACVKLQRLRSTLQCRKSLVCSRRFWMFLPGFRLGLCVFEKTGL
jgi:hypothetical protein